MNKGKCFRFNFDSNCNASNFLYFKYEDHFLSVCCTLVNYHYYVKWCRFHVYSSYNIYCFYTKLNNYYDACREISSYVLMPTNSGFFRIHYSSHFLFLAVKNWKEQQLFCGIRYSHAHSIFQEVDIDLVSTWLYMIVLFVMPAAIKMHAPLIRMIYISILIAANYSFIYYWNLSFEEIQIIFWCFTYIWTKFWKYVYMYMYTIIYIYSFTSLPHYSLQLWYRNVLIICEYNDRIRSCKKFVYFFV
jgi:hypothetical protein